MLNFEEYKQLIENLVELIPKDSEKSEEAIKAVKYSISNFDRSLIDSFQDKRLNNLAKQLIYAFNVIGNNNSDWKVKCVELMREAEKKSIISEPNIVIDIDYEKLGETFKKSMIEALKNTQKTSSKKPIKNH